MLGTMRARLAAIPDIELPLDATTTALVERSVTYLASAAATAAIASDPYWPKWDSPWWHMLALFELGLADRIPPAIARTMTAGLNALPVHTFPLRPDEWPAGTDPRRDAMCHCAVGCIDQVLAACGIDVDRELPWFAAWFTRYQMADGGYNCDESAYLVHDECPSSMVGTVPILEALTRRAPSAAADRAAAMVLGRELRHGSATRHNAEERDSAKAWSQLTFPRFYFYDVLRGLAAVTRYAVLHQRSLPLAAVAPAIEHLLTSAPDGVLRVGRRAWDGMTTWSPADAFSARHPVAIPPLVEHLGTVGVPSPQLANQWTRTRNDLIALLDAGQLT
jgi:hypothetical protein